MDSIIVTDRYRTPITAEKRDRGGVVLRGPRSWIALSAVEFERLVEFVRSCGMAASTGSGGRRLGRIERFPAPIAPQSDEFPPANELGLIADE
ncbi:hypothetical protein A5781_06115 [Mycobacterium sp. 852002-30065_SCH5024008]|nr:hypothetical protein A5781_06115 [Mycobacterium sp. 852002-30065_SCH5024008]